MLISLIDITVAVLPFASLLCGFLAFRMSALGTAAAACLVETLLALTAYHVSGANALATAAWGVLTMWSVLLLLWSGQLFGQVYHATGLIGALLESVESLLPARDRERRALAMVSLLTGFVATFNGYACYGVAIPGLRALGFEAAQSAVAYLIYVTWSVPFSGMLVGTVVGSTVTHVPMSEIVRASGLLDIPLVLVAFYATCRILRISLADRRNAVLFAILTASNVAAIVVCTQIVPRLYILTLMTGGALSLVALLLLERADPGEPAIVRPAWRATLSAWAPLVLAIAYAISTIVPAIARLLDRFTVRLTAPGFDTVEVNVLATPAAAIGVAIVTAYLVRARPSNVASDLIDGTRQGASSLLTLILGSVTVSLMLAAGQIALLGNVLAHAGRIGYELLDPLLTFVGGMAFGQGAPAVLMFAQMQVGVAAALHLPLWLLVGTAVLCAIGPTNAIKPPLIRFAASLAAVDDADPTIFRIGLLWGLIELAVVTVGFAVVAPLLR